MDRIESKHVEELQALLASIVEHSEDAIIGKTLMGIITSWNAGAEKIYGYSSKEVIGKSISILMPAGTVDDPDKFFRNIIDGQSVKHYETRRVRKDGKEIDVALTISPIRDASLGLIGISTISRDITQQKQMERELIKAQEAALEAARAKSAFLATMSHEIRTPLNAVIGMSGLVLDTKLTREQRDYIETIRRAADHLMILVNDILDFSKIESGKLELEMIDFSLSLFLKDLYKTFSHSAKKNHVHLLINHAAPELDMALRGDAGRLRQVMMNLVSNAIKFSPKGDVTVRVLKESETQEGISLRLEIVDNGIGIPKATLGRMFQAFSQGDSATARKYGGTGLGLSISKRLVDLMEGQIGVHSEEGKGSTFWIQLSFQKGRCAPKDFSDGLRKSKAKRSGRKHVRILIAEDNVANQTLALKILEKAGYRAEAVADGNEVLDVLREAPYDLILMDCRMPEMDGYKTTEIIRNSKTLPNRKIPIIAMTANALKGDREHCLVSGMNDYITKPVDPEKLVTTIEKWLYAKKSVGMPSKRKKKSKPVENALSPVVDRSRWKVIRSVGGKGSNLLKELIGVYLTDSSKLVESIQRANDAKDTGSLARDSHTLKSSSANLGAIRLSEVCFELEKLGDSGTVEGAEHLIRQMAEEYEKVKAKFEEELCRRESKKAA